MSFATRRLACLPYTALLRIASCRSISHTNFLATNKNQSALSETKQRSSLPSTSVAKAKEAAKDVSYGFVIIGGVLVTGAIFYVIFKELFSSNSPNGVYSSAQKKCLNDGRVCAVLGEPIKTFGEETSRGRRRHTSHQIWIDRDGKKHMAMKFYLKGTQNLGNVLLEAVENEAGNYEFKYLAVETQHYPKQTIVVEG